MANLRQISRDLKTADTPPLIERQGKTIDVVVPSPLHCLIGLVNKIYKSLLDVFPQAVAWPAKLHLLPQVQHGGNDFNGNTCHQMLKNIAVLESLTITRQQKKILSPFVACLHAFEKVVHGTFSHTLAPDFEDCIRMFEDSFLATGISVTSKATLFFTTWLSTLMKQKGVLHLIQSKVWSPLIIYSQLLSQNTLSRMRQTLNSSQNESVLFVTTMAAIFVFQDYVNSTVLLNCLN